MKFRELRDKIVFSYTVHCYLGVTEKQEALGTSMSLKQLEEKNGFVEKKLHFSGTWANKPTTNKAVELDSWNRGKKSLYKQQLKYDCTAFIYQFWTQRTALLHTLLHIIYLKVKLLELLQKFSQPTLSVSAQWDVIEEKKNNPETKNLTELRVCTRNFR